MFYVVFLIYLQNLQRVVIMKNTVSLKKNYQFKHVYNRGKSIANRNLVMYSIKNGLGLNQLGISCSKKVGKSVVRSRVTRLIRESYRLNEYKILKGYDIVFIARMSCNGASYEEISNSLKHLIKKHNMLVEKVKECND